LDQTGLDWIRLDRTGFAIQSRGRPLWIAVGTDCMYLTIGKTIHPKQSYSYIHTQKGPGTAKSIHTYIRRRTSAKNISRYTCTWSRSIFIQKRIFSNKFFTHFFGWNIFWCSKRCFLRGRSSISKFTLRYIRDV